MPPSESVLPFSPPRVISFVHLGLGVVGDLQRFRVVPVSLLDPVDVGEDGVGLGEFLQGLGLLDASEAVAHAVEDVPHAALAGEAVGGVALLELERLKDLSGREVGVTAFGLHLGVGRGVRLDEAADVGGELRVLDLGGEFAAGDEVLDAADAGACLVLPGGDGVAAEAEAAFGGAGTALAECVGDLGLEEAALVPGKAARCRTEQVVVDLNRDVHLKTLRKDRRVAYE
jgi:hypothetical protein